MRNWIEDTPRLAAGFISNMYLVIMMRTILLKIVTILLAFVGLSLIYGQGAARDAMNATSKNLEVATFAGGCFWCVESDFEKVDGVVEVISGYTGGSTEDPTYREELNRSGRFDKPIVTEIVLLSKFYRAEDYHQNYHKTHPIRYKFYRFNSGRDQFLKKAWSERTAAFS